MSKREGEVKGTERYIKRQGGVSGRQKERQSVRLSGARV